MPSKNEKRAAELGMSVSQYKKTAEYKSKFKVEDKFKRDLKKEGAWDSFQNLSYDQKEFAQYNWKTTREASKEKVKLLEESLKEATEQADPYWSSFLRVAQDEVGRAFDETKNTFEYQKVELEEKIKAISEDLIENKEFYSLEEQSDLAKLKQQYEGQRDEIITGAAEAGLTFSTKREVPMKSLEEYSENVRESTARKYDKKVSDLETAGARDTAAAEREIEQRAEDLESDLTGIGRRAEQEIGTKNLPELEGYNPLGDVTGDLYEKKVADIERRKQAIFGEKTQASLEF